MSFNRVYAWLMGQVNNGTMRHVKLDESTEALEVIDYAHHEIHVGSTFRVGTTAISLADAATQQFVMTVGTKENHALINGGCGGDAILEVFEAPTGVNGTNAITPTNVNRNSAKVSGTAVIADPGAVTAGTTIIASTIIPGGTKNAATGGGTSSRNELVLKPSTAYLFRLTNAAGAAKPASLEVEWYEHTPKN